MKDELAQKIMRNSAEGYDKIAKSFSDSRDVFWQELEFVKDFIKEGDDILDLGCGNARFFKFIKDKNIKYTGVDASKKLLGIAKEKYNDRAKFVHANAVNIPLKNNSFDVVVSFSVLHHIPSRKLQQKFLQEAQRVLKNEGLLILTTWNLWQRKYLPLLAKYTFLKLFGLSELDFKDIFMSFNKEENIRYLHAFTKRELENLAKQENFKIKQSSLVKRKNGQSNFLIICKKN